MLATREVPLCGRLRVADPSHRQAASARTGAKMPSPKRPSRAKKSKETNQKKVRKKPSQKPAWMSMVPGGKVLPSMTLEQLRSVKVNHRLLTEGFPGPPVIGYSIRSFRFLRLFALACIAEDKHPALTRCWKELDRLFMRDPALSNEFFVPSWVLFDFPCGPARQTVLDHFQRFAEEAGRAEHFAPFIEAAAGSRLGLYQEVLRSGSQIKYRELLSGRVVYAHASIESGSSGEIVLGRLVELDGQNYFFGDVQTFPAGHRAHIEGMVERKLFCVEDEATSADELYETFMRLAGPYWMSVVASNEATPILDPDHYRSYHRSEE